METPCWCTSVVHQYGGQKNSVNIWNLLWLSRRLIICTEQTNIYILSTFPNNLISSKKAKNHEIGIYFSTNAIVALCHALA